MFVFLSKIAFAQAPGEKYGGWLEGLERFINPQTGTFELEVFVQLAVNIANWMLGIAGSLALLFLIYGGFQLILSQGASGTEMNPGGFVKAKKILVGALTGLVIVLIAWAGVRFVVTNILGLEVSKGLRIKIEDEVKPEKEEVKAPEEAQGCCEIKLRIRHSDPVRWKSNIYHERWTNKQCDEEAGILNRSYKKDPQSVFSMARHLFFPNKTCDGKPLE